MCETCGAETESTVCAACSETGSPAVPQPPMDEQSGVETVRCLLCRVDHVVPSDAGFGCPGCGQQLVRFQCPHCAGPSKAWLTPGVAFTSCLTCGRRVDVGMLVAPTPTSADPVCPHCQTRGAVRTQPEMAKQGVSGTKATAAVVTGGLSLLATGLSRKGLVTRATCDACGSSWTF